MLAFSYALYGHFLQNVNETKYLGIIIDSKLNFNRHIDLVCKRANNTLSFLKRNLCIAKTLQINKSYIATHN